MEADLSSLTLEELEAWMEERGQRAFHGRQLFRWLHARGARSFEEMTDLSKALRQTLESNARLRTPEIVEERCADDGTRKLRYRLADGNQVEGVYIPEAERRTLCVSTQVGCGMGCAFCATASMGMVRSLTASEIVGQVEAAGRRLRSEELPRPVSNVVFMGMGEPLANLEAVLRAVQLLLHPQGLALSRRRVTVSTAGIVPAMEEFVRRSPAKLAVSLNATTDAVRDRIMPVNRRFPLATLLECCRNLPLQHSDRITFEYVMLAGVNDTDADAQRLTELLRGIRSKINLIPFNPFRGVEYGRPDDGRIAAFQEHLIERGYSAFVRQSRGQTLQGACGQLVTETGSTEDGAPESV